MPTRRAHRALSALPLLALVAGAVALGSSPILVRISELEPTATAFYRVALATPAFLLAWLAPIGKSPTVANFAAEPGERFWLWAAGGLFALDLLCLHWSLRYTSVANATLFLNFAPVFVALAAWAIFGERPAPRTWLSFMIAICGILLLVGGVSTSQPSRYLGDILGLLAGAAYGGYLLVVSRCRYRLPTRMVMSVTTLSCAVFLLPATLAMGETLIPSTVTAWATLLGLALVTHAGGQGLLVFAMKYLPASTSSLTLLLQPVVAACGAWVMFSEALSFWQSVGGGIVLSGIVLCHHTATRSATVANPASGTVRSRQ